MKLSRHMSPAIDSPEGHAWGRKFHIRSAHNPQHNRQHQVGVARSMLGTNKILLGGSPTLLDLYRPLTYNHQGGHPTEHFATAPVDVSPPAHRRSKSASCSGKDWKSTNNRCSDLLLCQGHPPKRMVGFCPIKDGGCDILLVLTCFCWLLVFH